MKKKGFTLIELLAVIIILAIIALIAVPVVINLIEKSRKSTFEDTAYGVIKAGELYYAEKSIDDDNVSEKIFDFENQDEIKVLNISGKAPTKGWMKISSDGKISLSITNGKYVVNKSEADTKVTAIKGNEIQELGAAVAIITSNDTCATTKGSTCAMGTEVNVQVNSSTQLKFHVLNDTGDNLTLLSDNIVVTNTAWINLEDYKSANGGEEGYLTPVMNNYGPLTLIKAIKTATDSWTNVPVTTFIYNETDNSGEWRYGEIEVTDSRARVLTLEEVNNIINNSGTSWLNNNVTSIWTASAVGSLYDCAKSYSSSGLGETDADSLLDAKVVIIMSK